MAEQTIISMPNTPEELGVALAPPELRKLDFSALDYTTLNRACIEYIRTYFPNDHNDFFANNGIIMLVELMSYIGNVLSQRSDILIDEAFISTAQTKNAVNQHLVLINQEIRRATPATVDVEISVPNPVPSEIKISAGTRFNLIGPDESSVYYEVYRAPNDFVSPISIPPNKRGIIAYGIEGYTETPVVRTSNGELNQFIEINDARVLDEPIMVEVSSGSTSTFWRRVDVIEKSGSNDEVFEVRHSDGKSTIIFGDNVTGSVPLSGQVITVTFRVGGGSRGRISAGIINETRSVIPQPPYTAAIEATFRNLVPSSGGTDDETVEQAKKRAPREFATHNSAITGEDYSLLASEYSHPVFGSVSKAVAVLRTGVSADTEVVAAQIRAATSDEEAAELLQSNFVNRNLVEFYVLAEGPNDTPILPNSGLKQGLISYFNDINVLTDEIMVLDGAIKPVDVNATVVISRSADAGTTKVAVEAAINDFFNLRNFDMGTELFVAHLYAMIQGVAGVKFVDIFEPADDVIKSYKKAEVGSSFVGYNEVITLGNVDLKFYYEPGNFKIPPIGR